MEFDSSQACEAYLKHPTMKPLCKPIGQVCQGFYGDRLQTVLILASGFSFTYFNRTSTYFNRTSFALFYPLTMPMAGFKLTVKARHTTQVAITASKVIPTFGGVNIKVDVLTSSFSGSSGS